MMLAPYILSLPLLRVECSFLLLARRSTCIRRGQAQRRVEIVPTTKGGPTFPAQQGEPPATMLASVLVSRSRSRSR
jgi:hypothetical protein